jgi:hypothetical protein
MTGTLDELVESVRVALCCSLGCQSPYPALCARAGELNARAAIVATLKGVRETMGGIEVSVFSGVLCKDDIDALIAKYDLSRRVISELEAHR